MFAVCVAIALVPAFVLIVGVRLPPCGHSANSTQITYTACDLSVQKAHLSFPFKPDFPCLNVVRWIGHYCFYYFSY